MSNQAKMIKWIKEKGSINITLEGKEERVFVTSQNFIEKFKHEIIETSGDATFRIIIRKFFEKLGETPPEAGNWESFEKYNDQLILPISPEGSNIPEDYKPWDGKARKMVLSPNTEMGLWSVRAFQFFKDAMEDIMTEKGANAILNGAGKKAGMASGEIFIELFGWKQYQDILDTIDKISSKILPALGWSTARVVTNKGQDGKDLILIKSWNSYEATKKGPRPTCIMTSSFYNGIWNSFAENLADLSAEAREVKCTAKGDDCCAFAIKFKDKGAPPLDWKSTIEAEWQEADKASSDLTP